MAAFRNSARAALRLAGSSAPLYAASTSALFAVGAGSFAFAEEQKTEARTGWFGGFGRKQDDAAAAKEVTELADMLSRELSTETLVEAATGIAFPAELSAPAAGGAPLAFAGAGVRIKYMFVKVYAVGAYFEAARLDGAFPPGAGTPTAFRIELAMDLTREKYNAAIAEQVDPRMARHGAAGKAAIAEFGALSAQLPANLAKGMAIELHLAPGGALTLRVGGATVGAMQSQEICDALKDVYLGADPVSPPMKEAALAGVKKM